MLCFFFIVNYNVYKKGKRKNKIKNKFKVSLCYINFDIFEY